MTTQMQPLTVKQMAAQAHVSERLMAQALRVRRNGVPELLPLVHPPHSATIGELLLMTDQLLPETQRAWAKLPPDHFHRAVRNLRRYLKGTALVQPASNEVEELRARVKDLETKLRRLQSAKADEC